MELAGLKVVMDADFSAVYAGFKQAEEAAKRFQQNTANIFKSVTINPDALAGAGKATEAVVKAQKEASAAIQEANVQWRNQAGTINNALSQNERYKAELAQVRRELKLTSAGQKDAAGNLRTVSSEVVNLRLREAQLKQAISENNISVRSQTKEMLAAHGSMVQLSQELGQMRTLYRQLSAEERNSPFGRQLVAQIKQADAEIKRLDASIGNHQRNVGNYASAFNPLNHNIAQITREFPAFANSMQTGFMAISNNIPIAVDSMRQFIAEQKQLQAQGKPSKTALQGLAGAVFSWNTALSAAITLSVVYGPKLIEMAKNGWQNADAIKEQKERQEALNSAYKAGTDQAGSQIAKIRVLNETMTNSNLTMTQRTKAYDEAVKLYPSYLSQISKEDALSGKLADTINDKLIPAILAAGKARGIENKITTLYEQELDLRDKLAKATREQAEAVVKANMVWGDHGSTLGKVWDALKGIATAGSVSVAADVSDATKKTENYRDAIIETKKSQQELAAELQEVLKGTGKLDSDGKDFASSIKTGSEKATTALQDLNGGVRSIVDITPMATTGLSEVTVEAEGVTDSVVNTVDALERLYKNGSMFTLNATKRVGKDLAEMKAMFSDLSIFLNETLTKSFTQVGVSLGNMFSGGEFDFVSGILSILGGQLKALGEYLIEIGVTKAMIDAGIEALSLTGVGAAIAIAAGTAAVAYGQYLQNQAKSKSKNLGRREFAAGGVVYGPTNALVGEYRGASSNPEVIAPLDKLTTILRSEGLGNGNMQPIVLTTRVDGQDLLILHDRAKNLRDR